jgi:hypothetical protein
MAVRLSPAEHKRRSDQAKRLLAEGKLGAAPNSGRPSRLRTKTAIEVANVIGGKRLSDSKLASVRDILRLAEGATETELLVVARVLAQVLGSVESAAVPGAGTLDPDGKVTP